MGEEQVMVRPELTLLARAAGRFSRGLSLWVDLAQREVSIRQAHAAFIFGKQVLQGRLDLPAEGTLEIGELNNYDRGLGTSPQSMSPRPIGITILDSGGCAGTTGDRTHSRPGCIVRAGRLAPAFPSCARRLSPSTREGIGHAVC